MNTQNIPNYAQEVLQKLESAGFEAFVVGGCVRDILLGKEPKDWDITTNALPEQVLALFVDGKYENNFGTVILPIKDDEGHTLEVLEVTTYRSEQGYSDRRHPDEIIFESELEKDLMRRDFTVNAMAIGLNKPSESLASHAFAIDMPGQAAWLVDLYGGRKDLRAGIIRAVGEPADRFKEDALRMMRAVRFSAQLGFEIEAKTSRAILKLAGSIKFISRERIRDELVKILSSNRPYEGMTALADLKMLQYILPELADSQGVKQNRHHIYGVFDHLMLSLKNCPSTEWQVRLAALLHDVGKPKTRRVVDGEATFYNHEMMGAKMATKIMDRLRFSRADSDRVVNLIRNHMFYYNVGEVTESSVRRLIYKVGRENLKDLIDLRIADRLGSGVPKAKPYKLRHLEYMLEKVSNDPVSVKMLKINGDSLIKELGLTPGPKIGAILDVLLAEAIEDPSINEIDKLLARSRELDKLDLAELRLQAKEKIDDRRSSDDKSMKKSFKVA
jgi:tRNA nucleotidyltransferase (CCA-adding enzyme)